MAAVTASLVSAGDRILVIDENGRGLVIKTGPMLEIIGRGKLDDTFWASPAITTRGVLLRGVDHLYCVR